jgi:hypothetical protein
MCIARELRTKDFVELKGEHRTDHARLGRLAGEIFKAIYRKQAKASRTAKGFVVRKFPFGVLEQAHAAFKKQDAT